MSFKSVGAGGVLAFLIRVILIDSEGIGGGL